MWFYIKATKAHFQTLHNATNARNLDTQRHHAPTQKNARIVERITPTRTVKTQTKPVQTATAHTHPHTKAAQHTNLTQTQSETTN